MGASRDDGRRQREPIPRPDQPDLVDAALLGEIELLGEVMASATDFPDHLSREEVDSVLGLSPGPAAEGGRGACPCTPATHGSPAHGSPAHGSPAHGSAGRRTDRPGGSGPETMGDLFRPEPEPWSLRGTQHSHRHVWSSMLTRLATERVPSTRQALEWMLAEAFHAVVGVDPRREPLAETSKQVYRLHVARDELSSGVVDVEDWKHRLIPLLLSRAGRTRSS